MTAGAESEADLAPVTLRPDYSEAHPATLVSIRGAAPVRVCGDSWCRGRCGLPAMVIPAHGGRPEMRLHGSMVACGPVMQSWRVEWTGARIEAPAETWEYLRGRWWI